LIVVTAILSLTPIEPSSAQPSIRIPADKQEELRAIVRDECPQCHGLGLIGAEGPGLLPADMRVRNEDEVVSIILNGKDGRMPPWRSRMNADEVRFIIREILSKPR
jgi:mono/diheme cytochrome c family protein